MHDKDLQQNLMKLGLTEYESKAYIFMLYKQFFVATDLAKVSKIPRTRIYEILDNLCNKGLCVEIFGKVKKFKAVSPEKALQRLLEYIEEENKRKENLCKHLTKSLGQIYKNQSSKNYPLNYIETYRDPKQTGIRFIELITLAKQEILIFAKHPFINIDKFLELENEEELLAIKRGIEYKALYEISQKEDVDLWQIEQTKRISKFGGSSRIIDELPLKMAIFDEETVIFALEDNLYRSKSLTSLIIQHKTFAISLKILFQFFWDKGLEYTKWMEKYH